MDGDGVSDEDEFGNGFDDEFDEARPGPLDEREAAMVEQDLKDLADFEATFAPEGYRGMAVWCHDCAEEHFYPWDMLRENLGVLLETGEAPVHEPAFHPEPARYVPWDYARGYVDALRDTGAADRHPLEACPRCGVQLAETNAQANYCPRCGSPLLAARLAVALIAGGVDEETATRIMGAIGLPRGRD